MIANHSEAIAFGVRLARRYYRFAFRQFPDDAAQAATLGALEAEMDTEECVTRAVARAMRRLLNELCGRQDEAGKLRRRSDRVANRWSAQRLLAVGVDPFSVARKTGLSEHYVRRLTNRTEEESRAYQKAAGKLGGVLGATTRWPGWEERRDRARQMRTEGSTLAEIQSACGYKSLSAAHYACQSRDV